MFTFQVFFEALEALRRTDFVEAFADFETGQLIRNTQFMKQSCQVEWLRFFVSHDDGCRD